MKKMIKLMNGKMENFQNIQNSHHLNIMINFVI